MVRQKESGHPGFDYGFFEKGPIRNADTAGFKRPMPSTFVHPTKEV